MGRHREQVQCNLICIRVNSFTVLFLPLLIFLHVHLQLIPHFAPSGNVLFISHSNHVSKHFRTRYSSQDGSSWNAPTLWPGCPCFKLCSPWIIWGCCIESLSLRSFSPVVSDGWVGMCHFVEHSSFFLFDDGRKIAWEIGGAKVLQREHILTLFFVWATVMWLMSRYTYPCLCSVYMLYGVLCRRRIIKILIFFY